MLVLLLICGLGAPALADLSLPRIFTDRMVLQRGMAVPVWGTAPAGAEVTVRFAGQAQSVRADRDGRWRLELKPLKASQRGRKLIVQAGDEEIAFTDVLVGEVWLFSGQSNMGMSVRGSSTAEESIAAADLPRLRFFQPKPGRKRSWQWVRSSPKSAPGISAVSFYYGRALHRDLEVPVGMIVCAKGGTMIQSWISREGLEGHPRFKKEIFRAYERTERAEHLSDLMGEKWERKLEKTGGDEKKAVESVMRPANSAPGRNFEQYGMREIAPYALRGFGWYQGESNAWGFDIARRYRAELDLLIGDWRRHWGGEDRPFLVVQLPHYPQKKRPEPPFHINPWCVVMEAQWEIQNDLPEVYTAVTSDLGEVGDIHPDNKAPVGERLSLLTRKYVHGHDVVARGPVFDSMTVEDDRARLTLAHVDGGLEARAVPPTPAKAGRLEGFLIAGEDRRFVRAHAEIQDGQVVCWSDKVEEPAAVRFAMHGNCLFNLYNEAGLPAAPFRTDEWPTDIPPREEHAVSAARTEKPPQIDGRLDDPCWKDAVPVDELQLFHTYHAAEHQTEARFARDDRCLYVAFECRQPMDSLRAEAEKRDDERIWSDDNVQLFLDLNHDRETYVRIAVNPDGAVADGSGYNDWRAEGRLLHQNLLPHYRDFDLKADVECEVATERHDEGWTVELAIPWSVLGLEDPPGEGKTMGLQFTRTHAASSERSEWATTGRDYNTGAMLPYTWTKGRRLHHGVGRFGTLKLGLE